jgi:AcrR family transcriptional regulator
MGTRDRKRAESVQKLLDAAEELFVQHGIANVSLEKVAARAGLTRGAIYWNFADKEDLALALVARRRGRDLESWERSVQMRSGGGAHLTSLEDWFEGLLVAGPDWFAFEIETLALATRAEPREAAAQMQRVMLDQFTHLISAECGALGVDPPDDLERAAELVAALANGLVLAWLGDRSLPVARLFADGVARLLSAHATTSASEVADLAASLGSS